MRTPRCNVMDLVVAVALGLFVHDKVWHLDYLHLISRKVGTDTVGSGAGRWLVRLYYLSISPLSDPARDVS